MSQPVITQMCVVVENVKVVNRHWAKVLEREEAQIITIFPKDVVLHYTNGQQVDYVDCQVAKYDLGNMILELIQPGESMSPWRKFLEEKGQGVFHFCIRVEDRVLFQNTLSEIGVGLPYHIGYFGGGSYSYAAASPQLGVELSINNYADNGAVIENLKAGLTKPFDELGTGAGTEIAEDMKKYFYRDGISYLKVYDLETGEIEVLDKLEKVIEAPNWSRDGKTLIYNSEGRLHKYSFESGETKVMETGYAIHCNNDHVLSQDGKWIAISDHTSSDFKSRILKVPFEGGDPILVTTDGPSYLHGWSPDQTTLAYCAERNGQYDIYTISENGGAETQLTNLPGLDDGPEYSPCGKYIWFNSTRSGLMQVWRMDANGDNMVQMTADESNSWFPHVSPDGKHVVYITYRKGDVEPGDHPANKNVEIRLMSSEGGDYKTLVPLFGGQGTMNVNSWSPDSKKFAFVTYEVK